MHVYLLDASNNVVADTWSMGGMYSFTNVTNGTYKIQVVLPTGYVFAPQDQGGNDNTDSDVNSSGYSGTFTVAGMTFFDLDAGVFAI